MSKKVLSLYGRKEDDDNFLDINSFYGGVDKGNCVQLTLDHDYIQLERADILELVGALIEWLLNG